MSNFVSRWFAKRTYVTLIKTDLKSSKAQEIFNDDALVRYIYNQHDKVYKQYGISLEEVKKIVIKEQLKRKGVMGRAVLGKARRALRGTIKEKRVVFLGEDSCEYTDKKGRKLQLNFDGLAIKLMDSGGQRDNMAVYLGITDYDIRKIVDEEFKRSRK